MFPPGDPDGLARALERALGDAAWREAARERNRRVIETRGDWSRNMAEIEALFERLAGAGRTGARGARDGAAGCPRGGRE
jgi:glycosyltransferase involved in cell wall biosynthesis